MSGLGLSLISTSVVRAGAVFNLTSVVRAGAVLLCETLVNIPRGDKPGTIMNEAVGYEAIRLSYIYVFS